MALFMVKSNPIWRPDKDWIGLSSVLRPGLSQHSIGYMGDGFYRSKDPTNSILKEQIVHRQIKHTISRHEHKTQQVPYNNMG